MVAYGFAHQQRHASAVVTKQTKTPTQQLIEQHATDAVLKASGGRLIAAGTSLLNPWGAEDVVPIFGATLTDEIIGAGLVLTGSLMIATTLLPNFVDTGNHSPPNTSTTGHTQRGNGSNRSTQKQIRSTSRSYSRRNYYNRKKRWFYR